MHKVLKTVTSGSVGDLGKIALALEEHGVNIDAIGGGEGDLNGVPVGIIVMLVTSDDDSQVASGIIRDVDLGNGHHVVESTEHDALDLQLDDSPGTLAAATSLLGNANPPINIMGVISVDVHVGWGIVSLGFEDGVRDTARDLLVTGGYNVLEEHGGRDKRHEVDEIIRSA